MQRESYWDSEVKTDTMHSLTLTYSGSWRTDITVKHGKVHTGNPEQHKEELMVKAECSCGKEFTNESNAYKHIKEVQEKYE